MITVATNGVFDLLHVGHLDLLEYARSLGDELIVGINADESVRQRKGNDRPINSTMDRLRMLSALRPVTQVLVFYEQDAAEFLRRVQPAVWVKGSDYKLETLNPREKAVVEECGGKIVIFSKVNHRSTTDIIERIRGRNS